MCLLAAAMLKPVKPAAWQTAEEPQALSLPAFRQWQRRQKLHQKQLTEAREVTDVLQYEREAGRAHR